MAYAGGFGMLLGRFGGHSELTLGPLLAYEHDFGMVKVSSWVDKSQFLANTHFPAGFK